MVSNRVTDRKKSFGEKIYRRDNKKLMHTSNIDFPKLTLTTFEQNNPMGCVTLFYSWSLWAAHKQAQTSFTFNESWDEAKNLMNTRYGEWNLYLLQSLCWLLGVTLSPTGSTWMNIHSIHTTFTLFMCRPFNFSFISLLLCRWIRFYDPRDTTSGHKFNLDRKGNSCHLYLLSSHPHIHY